MLRRQISITLARYFRLHLKEELNKSEDLLNLITLEGIPFRELTATMCANLEIDFPELRALADPEFNLFRKWNSKWKTNESKVLDYEKSTYKLYNQIYYERILDLSKGTKESRLKLEEKLKSQLSKSSFFGHRVTFGLFFQGESYMRESVREIFSLQNEFSSEEAYQILLEQSDFIAKCGYDYFDSIVQEAYEKSDSLLKNILPNSVAEELKANGKVTPIHVDAATVLFTDFSGFTKISTRMSPQELIRELDICFSAFDSIIGKYNLEKIKTIGDAYLCVGGLFGNDPLHAANSCYAALEISEFIRKRKLEKEKSGLEYWDIRIGLHTGELVAGVIGDKKFAFDIWGDTVNTASRMESSGEIGKINVSEQLYQATKDKFHFVPRCEFDVKGKGKMKLFLLTSG